MNRYFLPGSYDLLRKNCNSFTDCAICYLIGARLDKKYRMLETIGSAVEKRASLVSKLSRGHYVPNPKADNFELNEIISHLGQERTAKKVGNGWEFPRATLAAADVALRL